MHDFSKATSSRSTKLVHGGVRYLQLGRTVSLVIEALKGNAWPASIQNAPATWLPTKGVSIVPQLTTGGNGPVPTVWA